MTDLTEQWKKGELPEGFYYVKDGENMIAEYLDGYFYNNGEPMTSFSGGVDEVIAKVPTYEEYRNLQHCWVEELEENVQLKEQQESLEDNYNELVCINANLEDNCKTLAQKLLQVKPELREWLEVNYKEYL